MIYTDPTLHCSFKEICPKKHLWWRSHDLLRTLHIFWLKKLSICYPCRKWFQLHRMKNCGGGLSSWRTGGHWTWTTCTWPPPTGSTEHSNLKNWKDTPRKMCPHTGSVRSTPRAGAMDWSTSKSESFKPRPPFFLINISYAPLYSIPCNMSICALLMSYLG